MKKTTKALFALTGLAGIACLASCGSNTSDNSDVLSASEYYSEENVLARETISAFNTIDVVQEQKSGKKSSHKHSRTEYTTPETVDMDQMNALIDKANVLLANSISIEKEESDLEEYIEKQILTYNDKTYVMYVSESETTTEEKEERDGVEIETETKYSGILIDGENQYPFVAKTEDEIEDPGTEEEGTETELKLTVTLDEQTTVTIKQEIEIVGENVEEEFSCKYKVDGETTEAFKVSSDYEDGVRKIKVKENDTSYKLKYYTEDGVDYLNIKYDTYTVLLTVTTTTDENGNVITTYAPVVEEAEETTEETTVEDTTTEAATEVTE